AVARIETATAKMRANAALPCRSATFILIADSQERCTIQSRGHRTPSQSAGEPTLTCLHHPVRLSQIADPKLWMQVASERTIFAVGGGDALRAGVAGPGIEPGRQRNT